jgi:hypothetical protein
MPDLTQEELLARLDRFAALNPRPAPPADPAATPAAPARAAGAPPLRIPGLETDPRVNALAQLARPTQEGEKGDHRLDELLRRISEATGDPNVVKLHEYPASRPAAASGVFLPIEPASFEEAKVTDGQVEALLLKYLLAIATASGRDCSAQVRLPFKLIDTLLARMKNDQLVYFYADAPMNDYVYQLTDLGRERARRFSEISTYFGSAPVALTDYIHSVAAQTLTHQRPTLDDLKRAFSDLLINDRMLLKLGPAINSGRGLFLFGPPGNGKTSIAERVTAAFGSTIWIPRALNIDGEILRLYDPIVHEEVPLEAPRGLLEDHHIDKRWVQIRRPTIISGGELTMENLEVAKNVANGTYESPLQLKSNCGTLVIDDFGRQQMSVDRLLNRWIVPLEKRYDFLNMPSGKKVQVPFDQLIIFSTNLQPKELVDDAFLRRIPYKVEVIDPSEQEFRELFRIMAPKLGVALREEVVDHVINKHYKAAGRPFRACQPRDLLLQVRNYCRFVGLEPEMTPEYLDFAVENYFAVM